MGPCVAVEGATTARVFEAYVERVLAPALRPGRVVVMDNLSAHKGERVRELAEARGCEVLFLPAYSPDLSPIEEAFSKLKALLCAEPRRARRRRLWWKRSDERWTRSRQGMREGGSPTAGTRFGVSYLENRCMISTCFRRTCTPGASTRLCRARRREAREASWHPLWAAYRLDSHQRR